jgi:hypothetical protein
MKAVTETTNTKKQIPTKVQIQIPKPNRIALFSAVWALRVGHSLGFGVWRLGFLSCLLFGFWDFQPARAADAWYRIPIMSLNVIDGSWPSESDATIHHWRSLPLFQPYATLEGEGEVYVDGDSWHRWTTSNGHAVAIRAPKDKDVLGTLFVPKADLSGMVALKFKVSPASATTSDKDEFLRVKERHYQQLRQRNIPGAAWFRYQERETAKIRGQKPDETVTFSGARTGPFQLADTYELFSGGRAISENLQLDRDLRMRSGGENTTDITNLAGITVREMNWKPLLAEANPRLDLLASYVPFDQHVIFFPSFSAMTKMFDEADLGGTPLLQWLEPRSEDAQTRVRYHKQLCLEVDEMSRVLGPQVILSVAITGSDPYLRTGSDVGILFEAKSPALLKATFTARQIAAKQGNPGIKSVNGEVEGVPYAGVVSEDRSVSSFIAAVNDVVFVSNSLFQLGQLIKTATGKKTSLAAQEDYIFFRQRYARTDKDETAFLILTDATIRRWCGPQWRIGNSRRTRVAAAMAQAQAAHLPSLADGTAKPGRIPSEISIPGAEEFQVTSNGISSPTYGTLDFLTPIAELSLTRVSTSEVDAYTFWRNSYQQNWRQFFDPIAVRISMKGRQLSAEVTVMPLIASTEYAQFISLTRGGRILPGAGDPHDDTLLHLVMGLNTQSELVQSAGNWMGSVHSSLRANPLGWLGSSISIYADRDAFWDNLRKAENGAEYFRSNYHQLPIALHCDAKNPLGLTAFLAAARAYVDQTAPGMTIWQTMEHNGKPYVKIAPAQAMQGGEFAKLAIYYAATPQSLVLTLNEPLLKRTLDRQGARDTAKAPADTPWLGTNLCLKIDQQFLGTLESSTSQDHVASQRLLSWNNLPILNEWKRLFPDEDPVKLHERFWQTKLVCPGGGSYVWNEKWHTMESTVYGHPGEPKKGPDPANAGPLARFQSANLGLSFENQGLSARIVLEQETKSTSAEQKKLASTTRLWRFLTGKAL